ncbi:hypothetical protein B4N84_06660 [Flavobacterium sp. IR1]|nr:hypothetical protein B4N84_06660 [Flavobacterium sp. IR1]
MKKILLLVCLTALLDCASQPKKISKEKNKKNKNIMEYFNEDTYKDWEIDTDWTSSEDDKSIKKENERLRISFDNKNIQVEKTSIINPYKRISVYDKKTKLLRVFIMKFYQFSISILKNYDEMGSLIEETNYDKPYVFALHQLIEKIKKEEDVDLEDLTQKSIVDRHVDKELGKPIYEVYLRSKIYPDAEFDYFLIDGITGEVIFKTTCPVRDEEPTTPLFEYKKALRKKVTEDNSYYKSYKGKDYTKKEWEAFEEEWYRDFEEKKEGRNFFWDNIFKKLNE